MSINAASITGQLHQAANAYARELRSPGGPPAPESSTTPTGADTPYLTVKGLTKAWGESNSVYDLDDDGTVNVSDLMVLLGNGGVMNNPDAPLTIEGMKLDWGKTGSVYDLTGDGTVDVNDLLELLAAGGEMPSPVAGGDPSGRGGAPSTEAPGDVSATPAAPTDGSETKPAATKTDGDPADAVASPLRSDPADATPARDRDQLTQRGAGHLADIILQRLEAAGYVRRPPQQVHDLIDRLQLSGDHRKTVLDRIAQRYPQGLGIRLSA